MAKAIERIPLDGMELTVGHFGLGARGSGVGSVRQQVHDGDTLNVRALGNFGVRFLGIDAPEISFTLPGTQSFVAISDERWEAFLAEPFAGSDGSAFKAKLSPSLVTHLEGSLGPGVAANHHNYAEAAKDELVKEVESDLEEMGQTKEKFQFFLAFASEIMDRYGRLLSYVNRQQKEKPRPLDYNQRLLKNGLVSPYFIWPNINPFRRRMTLLEAVPDPNTANEVGNTEATLRDARKWIKQARADGVGIFNLDSPLKLQPFEIRFLAQRRLPERWVVDLSKNEDGLIPPQEYHTVPNMEDRLEAVAKPHKRFMMIMIQAIWRKASYMRT